ARGDVDRRPEKSIRASGRVAQAAPAHLQPMPLIVRMSNAVLQLEMLGAPVEMVTRCFLYGGSIVRMDLHVGEPLRAGRYRRTRTFPVQRLHLRREIRRPVGEAPIPMAFVRAFHGEGIAFLARPQRT